MGRPKPMRILLLVHHFPPHHTGGAEWRAFRTARSLQERGHEVRVLCVEDIDRGPADGVAWQDDSFRGISVRRLSFDMQAAPDPFRWAYDNPWIGDHLRDLSRSWRPQVMHLIGGYLISGRSLLMAREIGLPTVVTLTDFWFLCPRITMLRSDGGLSTLPIEAERCARCLGEERRRHRWAARAAPGLMARYWRSRRGAVAAVQERMAFLKRALSAADAFIAPSRFLERFFLEWGLDPARMHFLRQGLDRSADELVVKSAATGSLRLAYIGQLAPHKGAHLLLEALQRMPQAALRLEVYGDLQAFPRYVRRLRRMAAMDGRVALAGTFPRRDLPRVLSNVDLVVVPSIWYENSPNVILEAFAHETPVMVSDLGGMAELVEEGVNGLRFPPGDAAALAQVLSRIVEEPTLLGRLRAGIKPIKPLSVEMDELEALYRRVRSEAGRSLEAIA